MSIDPFNLITCHDVNKMQTSELIPVFSLQNADTSRILSSEVLIYEGYLEKLVFLIARKPNCLIIHVQRIFYCFHANLNEQLFAAIVDFLVILNRRGQAISRRMVIGAKSRLSAGQIKVLKNYLKNHNADINSLSGNRYSIFTKGLLGANNMIQSVSKPDEPSYDPLEIAYDHIEYSQLEEAKRVLEKGILEQPTRLELHHELLALYQFTTDVAGFNQMSAQLTQSGIVVTEQWTDLNNFFNGASING
ncbi:MAG: hypothetical protein ACXWT3_01810 [Methylococcaceae bacterium]